MNRVTIISMLLAALAAVMVIVHAGGLPGWMARGPKYEGPIDPNQD